MPRFIFTDFPLGNSCGRPYDVEMQREIVGMGLDLLEHGRFPGTTIQTRFQWDETGDWRESYMRIEAVGS